MDLGGLVDVLERIGAREDPLSSASGEFGYLNRIVPGRSGAGVQGGGAEAAAGFEDGAVDGAEAALDVAGELA